MSEGLNISDLSGGSKAWGGEGASVGDKISGVVVSAGRIQQTGFTDGTPLFWDNGDPRMMSKVEIQTDLQDSDDDDGVRTLYLKGGNYEAKEGSGLSGEKALAEAMKAAGLSSLEEGCKLQAAITGLAKVTQKGYQPAKLWTFKVSAAPASSISADDLFDD